MDENTSPNDAGISEISPDLVHYEKYLIFTVRDKRYALPSKIISEVTVLEKVFPLPLIPDYILGIINRYSVPYALIDLGYLLYKDQSEAGKVIVLKEEVEKTALLIDDVTDIADLSPDKMVMTEQDENDVSGLINGLFEWKDGPVFCLDTGELIDWIKQDLEL